MSTQRVVVDPITRIEGHLRVEAFLNDEGVIEEAMSSCLQFLQQSMPVDSMYTFDVK